MVHIMVNTSKERSMFVFNKIDFSEKKYKELTGKFLGTVRKEASGILEASFDRFKKMGLYHWTLNNCQDYCQQLGKDFGLTSFSTGTDTVVAAAAIVGIGALVVGVLYLLFKPDDKK